MCMVELGELEGHHEGFSRRNARVIVVSVESRAAAEKTKNDFPHLLVVADEDGKLIREVQALHEKAGPGGQDIAAPTTILIDRNGIVRWLFRPDRSIERLAAGEVLHAVDVHFLSRE